MANTVRPRKPADASPELTRRVVPAQSGVEKSDNAAKASPAEPKQTPPEEAAHGFEFGGPIGAMAIMVLLPFVVYLLFFLCPGKAWKVDGENYCASVAEFGKIIPSLTTIYASTKFQFDQFYSNEALMVVLGWLLFQALLCQYLPGEVADGVKLRTGDKLKYKLNGHLAFWVSLIVMAYGCPAMIKSDKDDTKHFGFKHFELSWCYTNFLQLATASIIVSCVLSVYLYVTSFNKGALLALGGNTGNTVYDFFIGRELNPRFTSSGTFDLKCFCELRPGLIGWVIINLGMACAQKEELGYISLSMYAVNVFQGLYVWDALFQERAVLTTMDITTDGFGFMLVFGDLCWVPFTYTLQARYLVENDPSLSTATVLAICVLNVIGYSIFRGANGEKDAFRRNPSAPECAHLKYLDTKRGTRLLISGWWGIARKINYTGDWLMGLAWCAITGFNTTLTYFYAIYFAILLVHRALRDDGFCRGKYGTDWDRYKKEVPAVFIPHVF